GSARAGLLLRAERLPPGLRRRVSIEPPVPRGRVAELLTQAHVAVQVSSFEGNSIFMLEALAAGCVPAMTRVSGTRGMIHEGVNGVTVPVGDVRALAAAVARLAADPEGLRRMSESAVAGAARFSAASYYEWLGPFLAGLVHGPH